MVRLEKEKTPFAAAEHRISSKDLLDGFNIPATGP